MHINKLSAGDYYGHVGLALREKPDKQDLTSLLSWIEIQSGGIFSIWDDIQRLRFSSLRYLPSAYRLCRDALTESSYLVKLDLHKLTAQQVCVVAGVEVRLRLFSLLSPQQRSSLAERVGYLAAYEYDDAFDYTAALLAVYAIRLRNTRPRNYDYQRVCGIAVDLHESGRPYQAAVVYRELARAYRHFDTAVYRLLWRLADKCLSA